MKKSSIVLSAMFVALIVAGGALTTNAANKKRKVKGYTPSLECGTAWTSEFSGMIDNSESNFVLGPANVGIAGSGLDDTKTLIRKIQTQIEGGCDAKFIYKSDDVSDSEVCQTATVVKGSDPSYSSIICEGKRAKYELKFAHNPNIENPLTITRSAVSAYEDEGIGATAYPPGGRSQMIYIFTKR